MGWGIGEKENQGLSLLAEGWAKTITQAYMFDLCEGDAHFTDMKVRLKEGHRKCKCSCAPRASPGESPSWY